MEENPSAAPEEVPTDQELDVEGPNQSAPGTGPGGESAHGGGEGAPDGGTEGSNTRKDPDEWVTGEEPMTGAQASYLRTLSQEANEPFDEGLTKAEASKRIDELQAKTGRGR